MELRDIRNAGNIEKKFGCDMILKLDDQEYFLELKASLATGLPTKIRFTHQTLATRDNAGVLHKMTVVFVYNLGKGAANAKFKFFRYGDIKPDQIHVEPHFIVQPIQAIKKPEASGIGSPINDSLEAVLGLCRPTTILERFPKQCFGPPEAKDEHLTPPLEPSRSHMTCCGMGRENLTGADMLAEWSSQDIF
jgi:hypothetical protein